MRETLAVRFWSKVRRAKPQECWVWTGSTDENGYGRIAAGRHSPSLAHRVAWELTNGPIPDGIKVLHKCDNRPCCNQRHLFLGTTADNNRDMYAKGRGNPNGGRTMTACRKGHPRTPENTASRADTPNGVRCRVCERMATKRRRGK